METQPQNDLPAQDDKPQRPRRRILKGLAGTMLALSITLTGSGYWIFNTPSGLQWLFSTVQRISGGTVQFEAVNGTAAALHIGRLNFTSESMQIAIDQFEIHWSPYRLLTGELLIHAFSVQSIDLHTAPSEEETTLPGDLSLPVGLTVEHLRIDALRTYSIDDQPAQERQPDLTLTDMSLRLKSDARQHTINHLALNTGFGVLQASGSIETALPFRLRFILQHAAPEKWGTTQATATGTLEQLNVKLRHRHTQMQAFADAWLQPFTSDPTAMVTALKTAVTGFNPADFFPETPQAGITLHTALRLNPENRLEGTLTLVNKAAATLDRNGLPLSAIRTAVLLDAETLKLDNLKLLLTEKSHLSGHVAWHFKQAFGQAAISVSNLNPAAIDTQWQAAGINGTLRLTGDAAQQRIEARLHDRPLKLKLDVAAVHSANRIVLEHVNLNRGQSSLSGSGAVSLPDATASGETLPFHFTGRLRQFNIADFVQGYTSSLNLKLDITGNHSPELTGTLDYRFEESHFNHQPVSGKGRITFAQPPSTAIAITSAADLQIGSNHLKAHGKYGKPGDMLTLQISAPALDQAGLGLSGALNAQIDMRGTIDKSAINFDIDGTQLALPGAQSIGNLAARGKIHPETLALALSAHQIRSADKTLLEQLQLKVDGRIPQHTIQADLHIDQKQSVILQADGGLIGYGKPGTTAYWQGLITQLTISGQLPVTLQTQAALTLGSDKAVLSNARLAVADGEVNIENAFWSPAKWESSGHFSSIRVHPGSDLIPQENILQLRGQWNIQAQKQLKGEISISREQGDWYLPGELPYAIGLQDLRLHIDASGDQLSGRFDLTSEHLGQASARIALPAASSTSSDFFPPHTPLNGTLNVQSTDLSWLDYLTDSAIHAGGGITLEAAISGTLGKPALQGRITGEQLAFALPDEGLNLDQGQLAARFDQSALHIDRLYFVSPHEAPPKDRLLNKLKHKEKPGSVEITGSLGYADNAHQLNVAIDQLYLVHPPHYWIVASGSSSAKMSGNVLDLDGEITADAGLITQPPETRPQLADDIILADDTVESPGDPATDTSTVVNLNATLNLGQQFYLRVAGLEGRLDGSLKLRNDAKGLSAVGSIATRNTTYKAYGQNLTVERGIVNFHGPLDDPGLNVRAIRKGLAVEAGVEVAGTVRHPQIKLVSSPNVPDTEKLSWIALGRAPDVSGLDTSLLVTAANSILGGQSGFGVTDQIRDLFGFDEFSFRQGSTAGSTSDSAQTGQAATQISPFSNPYAFAGSTLSGQIGTIGKRISSRAYLSYERGITATTAGITKLTYTLTPSITVVTQAGEDSAVDLFYTFRFD
ncbi:MAG: translocation/assembly module TamB domain-containing protein [Nitrosomonas sp.]|nr:translocation/assembly module TamB domain-containing protein [Nitrosomonas sp.]